MSRREGRDFGSRSHRSGFDRESSPKRSRWDDKPITDRPSDGTNLDSREHIDHNQKQHRLQDGLPFDGRPDMVPKPEVKVASKIYDNKITGQRDGTQRPTDPTDVPRSRSYFQHDERLSVGQVGRSFSRRVETEHGWRRTSRDQQSARAANKAYDDVQKRDEKPLVRRDENPLVRRDENPLVRRDENQAWRHDRYFERKTDRKPPVRKRPSFKEVKDPANAANTGEHEVERERTFHSNQPFMGNGKGEEREGPNRHHSYRAEKGNREANRGAPQRVQFSSRDRNGGGIGGGGYNRGREKFNAGRIDHQRVVSHDKEWKHDLFEEANRSPTPKNEDDHVARIEALLAS